MPYRVQRIEEFVKELDSGDLKLRVRVLEVNTYKLLSIVQQSQERPTRISFFYSVGKSSSESDNIADGDNVYSSWRNSA